LRGWQHVGAAASVLVPHRYETREEAAVDWIEKVFHVSPDGGNGTFEFVLYIVLITAVVVGIARAGRVARRARSKRRH
jgi:hypothetical protein